MFDFGQDIGIDLGTATVIAYVKKVDSGFKIASVSDIYPY